MQSRWATGGTRWAILVVLFAITSINYADRATLSLAAPALSRDLHIDPLELGIVFSAFGWSYVLAQVPGGWLLDRFGAPKVYFWAIILWSIFTGAQSTVVWLSGTTAICALFVFRFLVGLAEAPSFPGNSRIVAGWFPASERGTATAIFNSAQYFATVLFAPLMGLIIALAGWPWVFIFMSVAGLLGAAVWRRMVYEPREHPRVSAAELDYIAAGGAIVETTPQSAAKSPPGLLKRKLFVLLGTPTLLGLYLSQFSINTLTYFFITWFPVYLVEDRGLSIVHAGLFATLPAICGFVGGVLGGIFSDWLLRRGFSLTRARKIPVVAGMTLALSIVGCNYVESNAMLLLLMSLAFFGKGIGALGWAVMSDVAPRDCAGLSGGIFNMFGNLSSILTPIVIGYILLRTGSFDLVLGIVAGAALVAALCYLLLVGEIRRLPNACGSD